MTAENPQSSGTSVRSPQELFIFGGVLLFLIVILDLFFYSKSLEDAFITFRYSRNIAEGRGFGSWNRSGPPVEGFTSLLWMLVLSMAPSLNLQIETLSKIVGIISHIGLAGAFLLVPYVGNKNILKGETLLWRHKDIFLYSAAILGLYLPISWYASTGMETLTFMLLVSLAILAPLFTNAPLPLAIISILLVITRPEGILFSALMTVSSVISERGKKSLTVALAPALGAAFAFILLLWLRSYYFGSLLPNTYYAKVSGSGEMHLAFGRRYLNDWVDAHQWFYYSLGLSVLLISMQFLRSGMKRHWYLIVLTLSGALFGIYFIRVGGDNHSAFPFWRHFLHIMPLLALLISIGLVNALPRFRIARHLLLGLILLFTNLGLLKHEGNMFPRDARNGLEYWGLLHNNPPNPYYLWLREISDANTTIASSFGGELPYIVDRNHIDVLGLNDPYIARHGVFDPEGPVDSKTDMGYVVSLRPDIIEGYLPASLILDGQPRESIITFRRQMSNQMLASPIFRDEYLLLMNGPYDQLDRVIFLHRTYWERHPMKHELQVIPVTSTTLYNP